MKERKQLKLANLATGKTAAQIMFNNTQILTARPEDMTFETYKQIRFNQQLVLRKIFTHCPNRRLLGIIPRKHYPLIQL